jgi:hypothetical protein
VVACPATSGTAATKRDVTWQPSTIRLRCIFRRLWTSHDPFLAVGANPTTGHALVE